MGVGALLRWVFLLPISLVGLVMLILLPLIVLIKSAVFAYSHGISTFFSLAIGSIATFMVLLVYLLVLDRLVKRRNFLSTKAKFIVVSLVIVSFNTYALIEVSEHNVKDKKTASEYHDLHPILRIGVRIWSLFDQRLVITDMSRSKQDYKRMRVTAYRHSLHFPQKDGFVHAVDLRTKRRSKIRNWISQTVFNMMGFGTLRHVGSADHLHVELVLTKEASIAMNRIARSRLAKRSKKRKRLNKRRKTKVASSTNKVKPTTKQVGSKIAKPSVKKSTVEANNNNNPKTSVTSAKPEKLPAVKAQFSEPDNQRQKTDLGDKKPSASSLSLTEEEPLINPNSLK